MDFPFFASPNFTPGRKKKISGIILHKALGRLEKTIQNCFDPASLESFHFLILKTGKIIQMVKCQDTAWHAGWITADLVPGFLKPNPNFSTIGIALEAEEGENFWTTDQKEALEELLNFLSKNLKIPLDSDHLLGHSAIDPVRNPNDPGDFLDWRELFLELGAEESANVRKRDLRPNLKPRSTKKTNFRNPFLLETLLKKLFYGMLNREPNISELDYYKHSNLDVAQIARRILETEEFKKRYTTIIKNK